MPKTDLHCHLGGSIRITTLIEFARKFNIKLPSYKPEILKKHILCKEDKEKCLNNYLLPFRICESIFRRAEVFQRVAYEVCEDAAQENVKLFELRFAPTNYTTQRLKLNSIIKATLDGLNRAARDFNMHTGLIICGIRNDMEATRKAAELAVNFKRDGVVGFDLAGPEVGYRPKLFQDAFEPVHRNFIPVTIHAGEEDTVASIAEAIIYLNARRIGHGIAMRESFDLLSFVNRTRIGIEVCPTSNIDTGSVKSYQTHPIRNYFNSDLRISINTDNRLVSDTTVTKEYMRLIEELGFTKEEILKIARYGIKSAFMNVYSRNNFLIEFDRFAKKQGVIISRHYHKDNRMLRMIKSRVGTNGMLQAKEKMNKFNSFL